MSTGAGGNTNVNSNGNNNNSNPDTSSNGYTSGVFFGVFVLTLIAIFLYLCLRRCQRRRIVSAAVNRGALSSPTYFPEFYSGVRIEDIDEIPINSAPVIPARWPPPATTAFTLKDTLPSSNTTVVLPPPPSVHISIDQADIPTQAPPAYIVDTAIDKEGLTIVTTRDKYGRDQIDYVHTPSKSRREVLKGEPILEEDNPFFDPPSYGSRSKVKLEKEKEQRHEQSEEKEEVIELQDVHIDNIQDESLD